MVKIFASGEELLTKADVLFNSTQNVTSWLQQGGGLSSDGHHIEVYGNQNNRVSSLIPISNLEKLDLTIQNLKDSKFYFQVFLLDGTEITSNVLYNTNDWIKGKNNLAIEVPKNAKSVLVIVGADGITFTSSTINNLVKVTLTKGVNALEVIKNQIEGGTN